MNTTRAPLVNPPEICHNCKEELKEVEVKKLNGDFTFWCTACGVALKYLFESEVRI